MVCIVRDPVGRNIRIIMYIILSINRYLTPGQYYKISQLYLDRNWSRFSESVSVYSTCPEGKGLVGPGPQYTGPTIYLLNTANN